MGDASTINGDLPQSAFIKHITSYPVVSDSITTFKENAYGAKSIDLTNAGYAKFVKPTFPYLATPASYVKPYAAKADELGDKFLTKFDEKVPIVKSETQEIKGTVFKYVHWPLEQANATKDWALSTYSDESKKFGGGIVANGKAVVTTSLILSSDVLKWASSVLAQKKEQAKEIAADKTSN